MIQNDLSDSLALFSPINLDEMDSVQLMDRIDDTKYVFSVNRLTEVLKMIPLNYKIFEIEDHRNSSYQTTYMDTDDYLFFRQQMCGKLNRHKVRYRIYESTGTSYLEVKYKPNKIRVIKRRIENKLIDGSPDNEAITFLSQYVTCNASSLKPMLISRFNRITLVRLNPKERITIDYNLSFSSIDGQRKISLPFLAIVELKREGYSNQSSFIGLLKKLQIRPSGFSKYCMGIAMLYDLPRLNVLKSNFLILQKIKNDYCVSNVA